MPLISVIVPVYKVEKYLSRCVDSILSQSFTDFELVLVDDGSPDRCGEICDAYAKKDRRISVIHQSNTGLASARNAGLDWMYKNSNSEYVCFVDSDDWVHEKYLELLLKGIETFSADMSQCGFIKVYEQIDAPSIGSKILCISPEEQYLRWYFPFAWGKLFRTKLFIATRFPDGELFEDVLIWYKVLFSYNRIAVIDEPLYFYFQREDGIVLSNWTPAKLAQIRAWDDQFQFALQRGNQELLEVVIRRLFWVYKHQYREIRNSSVISKTEKRVYQTNLKRKLRKIVHRSWRSISSAKVFTSIVLWAFSPGDSIYLLSSLRDLFKKRPPK